MSRWHLLFCPSPPSAKKASHQIRGPRSKRMWGRPPLREARYNGRSAVNARWVSYTPCCGRWSHQGTNKSLPQRPAFRHFATRGNSLPAGLKKQGQPTEGGLTASVLTCSSPAPTLTPGEKRMPAQIVSPTVQAGRTQPFLPALEEGTERRSVLMHVRDWSHGGHGLRSPGIGLRPCSRSGHPSVGAHGRAEMTEEPG